MGDLLALAALLVVVLTGLVWFGLMRAVRLPRNRLAFVAAMALGPVLGVVAFLSGVGFLAGIAAALGIGAGAGFLVLAWMSPQERRLPAVRVGSPILDFEAPDAEGRPFRLASLHGRPFLLKFFRGHW